MFLIHDDQAKVLVGQEQRGPCPDHNLSAALPHHFPDAAAFGHGDAGMPFGGFGSETCLDPRQEFGRQGNFGQQNQRLPPLAQTFGDRL